LIMGHFLGNYIFFFISPWLLEWYPIKLFTLRKMVAIGGSPWRFIVPFPLILTIFYTSSLLFPHILGFWFHCPEKGLYLISW
jgi:hypothetical protein